MSSWFVVEGGREAALNHQSFNMKVCHSLICFFLLSLVDAKILVREATEGGNITVACSFTFSGNKKFFCKEECEEGNVLINTTGVRAQRGRYSIEYTEGSFPVSSTVLYVSISQLTKSDSGRYRCALDRVLFIDGFLEFEIKVIDAPTSSVPSASTPPGSFTPSSSSHQQHTDRPPAAPPAPSGVLLYVRVVLTIMVVLLSLTLLIFCRKRTNNNKDRSADTEFTSVTEANRVNEEIREDRRSRSPPEASSVNVYANFTKPTETTSKYSLVTAAGSQHKVRNNCGRILSSGSENRSFRLHPLKTSIW